MMNRTNTPAWRGPLPKNRSIIAFLSSGHGRDLGRFNAGIGPDNSLTRSGRSGLSPAKNLRVETLRGRRPVPPRRPRTLWHVICRIRRRWPKVSILVRADSHYCGPEMLALLRRLKCDDILDLSINSKLDRLAEPLQQQCKARLRPGRPNGRRFRQFLYKAGSWGSQEKVMARIERCDE